MGSGSSKCVNCSNYFTVKLANACGTTLCLSCNLNHVQTCFKCYENESFGGEYPEIKQIFQHVKSQIKSKDNHISQLEEKISNNDHIASSLDTEQRKKIKKLEDENTHLQQKVTEEKLANEALRRKLTIRQSSIQHKLPESTSQQGDIKGSPGCKPHEDVKQPCPDRDKPTDLSTLHEQLSQLKTELSTKNDMIASLKEEKNTLDDKIKQLEQENIELRKAAREIKRLEQENKDLRNKVETEIKQLEQENQELRKVKKEIKQLEQENKQLRKAEKEKLSKPLQKPSGGKPEQPVNPVQPIMSSRLVAVFPESDSTGNNNRYFLDVGCHRGINLGRIIINTRPDKAPEMCKVFHDLVIGSGGIYLGSKVVQTSPKNYIIFQNAAVFKEEQSLYPADVNDLEVKRGAIGMRVQGFDENQRKLVKSQFYIVLTDKPPPQFSYVFGYVSIEGCSICEVISNMNVSENIMINDLGICPDS